MFGKLYGLVNLFGLSSRQEMRSELQSEVGAMLTLQTALPITLRMALPNYQAQRLTTNDSTIHQSVLPAIVCPNTKKEIIMDLGDRPTQPPTGRFKFTSK